MHHNHLILSIECSHTQHNISANDRRKENCRRGSSKKFTANGLAEAYADLSINEWKRGPQHWKMTLNTERFSLKEGMFIVHYTLISKNDEKKKQN